MRPRVLFDARGNSRWQFWTFVEKPPGPLPDREPQIVTALLVRDSEVAAGNAPLISVRQNLATPGAKLGKHMRQFMAQRAIDFRWILEQTRVQQNQFLPIISGGRQLF
jgi:hypothetical protein